jgi:hypothetical protein
MQYDLVLGIPAGIARPFARETDPLLCIGYCRTISGRRSTYIITLQNTSEAHRLARNLNMMDFKSDKELASHLLRAQVLW